MAEVRTAGLLQPPRSAMKKRSATPKTDVPSTGASDLRCLEKLLREAKVDGGKSGCSGTREAAAAARRLMRELCGRDDVLWAGEHQKERTWYHLLLRARENGCGRDVIEECTREGLAACTATWAEKWGSDLSKTTSTVLSPCTGIPKVFSTIVNNFLAEEGALLAEDIEQARAANQKNDASLPPADPSFVALWQKHYKKVRRTRAWVEYHWTLDTDMIYYRLKIAQVSMSFGISAPSAEFALSPVKESLKQLAKCGAARLKSRPISFLSAGFNAFFMQSHELWKEKMAVLHALVGKTAGAGPSGEPERFNHLKEVLEVHFNAFAKAVQDSDFATGRSFGDVRTLRVLSLACYDALLTHGLKTPSRSANLLRHFAQQTLYQGDELLYAWTQSLLFRSDYDERSTAAAAHAVAGCMQDVSLDASSQLWMERAEASIQNSELSLLERSLRCASTAALSSSADAAGEYASALRALANVDAADPRGAELEIYGRAELARTMLQHRNSEAALCCGEEVLSTFFRTDPLLTSYPKKLNSLSILHQVFTLASAHCEALLVRGEVSAMNKILAQAIKVQASSQGSFSASHTAAILLRRGQGLLLTQSYEEAASSLRAGLTVLNYLVPAGCSTTLKLDCMLAYTDALLGLRRADLALSNIDKAQKILLPELQPSTAAGDRDAPWRDVLGTSVGLPRITGEAAAVSVAGKEPDVEMVGDDDLACVDQLLSQYCDDSRGLSVDLFGAQKAPKAALAKRDTATAPTQTSTARRVPKHEVYEGLVTAKRGQCLVACGSRRGREGKEQVASGRALLERCANTLHDPREKAKVSLVLAKLHPSRPDWHIPRPKRQVVSSPSVSGAGAGVEGCAEDVRMLQEAMGEGGALNGPAMITKTLSLELTRRLGRRNEVHAAHYLNTTQGWTVKHHIEGVATRRRIDARTMKGDWSVPPCATWSADPEANIEKLQALLPPSCVVVTLSENADGYLVVGRVEAASEPLVLGISECSSHIKECQSLLKDTLAAAKEHVNSVDKTRLDDVAYKQSWWEARETYDGQVKEVVENLGDRILGGWRGALLGLPLCTEVRGRLEELTKRFAARLSMLVPAGAQCEIDERMLLLLLSSVPTLHDGLRVDAARKKSKTSELYWRGTTSLIKDALYDLLEVTPDKELSTQMREIAREMHEAVVDVIPPGTTCARQHVLLVAGDLHRLPWEACSALDGEPVSRIPSLSYLMSKLSSMTCHEVLVRDIDPSRLFYVLNPDGNLTKTEHRFCDFLQGKRGWRGQVGCLPGTVIAGPSISSQPPADPEKEVSWRRKWIDIYRQGLTEYDVFVYIGHGTGEQFVPAKDVKGLGYARGPCKHRAGGLPITPKSSRAHRLSGSRPPPVSPGVVQQTPRQLTFHGGSDDEDSPDVRVPSTRKRRMRLPSQSAAAAATPAKTPGRDADARPVGAVTFLMGCSSGSLTDAQGELEPEGTPYAFLVAGAPAVVANLWDVTDGEIDRFTSHVLETWMPDPVGVPLTDVLHSARRQVKLRYLIGACPVVYGLPINPRLA